MPHPLGLAPEKRRKTCPPLGPWSQEADGSWFCVAPEPHCVAPWGQQHYHRAAGEDAQAGHICPWVGEEGLAIKEALR